MTTRKRKDPQKSESLANLQLYVQKLNEDAILPIRGSEHAAGYDLSSPRSHIIPAKNKSLIMTDLAILLPDKCYGRIAPRSGLAWKKHVCIGAGVIDPDYRGNIGVLMFNHSNENLIIERGDRIAQLILERFEIAKVVEVQELPVSIRGSNGFGSTGQ